jgi:hypothetical protein
MFSFSKRFERQVMLLPSFQSQGRLASAIGAAIASLLSLICLQHSFQLVKSSGLLLFTMATGSNVDRGLRIFEACPDHVRVCERRWSMLPKFALADIRQVQRHAIKQRINRQR